MKYFISTAIVIFLYASVFSQENIKKCITPEMNKQMLEKHPERMQLREQLEAFTDEYVKMHYAAKNTKSEEVYIIPIVFHVIHNWGVENVDDAILELAVEHLNEDYDLSNPDTANTIEEFKAIAADCNIEFRMAKLDPDGNCTQGITRTVSNETFGAGDNVKYLAPAWPSDQYLNVWVVRSIAGSAAAYAYYPGTASPSVDGILMTYSYVASSHTLTHEIGHYLNLAHPWGNSNEPEVASNCDMDDGVDDTPNTVGHSSCDLYAVTCGSLDNVQNFMDYSYCSTMFTEGQKYRMRAALNSSTGSRNQLWTEQNLIATGVADGYTAQECAPIPDFKSDVVDACAGFNIQFEDMSYNGEVASRTWTFEGGNPAQSQEASPIVTFPNHGNYTVTLSVENASGENTITKSDYVNILATNTGLQAPFKESFANPDFPQNTENSLQNWDITSGGWSRTNSAGADNDNASIRIYNYMQNQDEQNSFSSPNINIEGIDNPSMSFKVAYSRQTSDSRDEVKIYVSHDCGDTWFYKYYLTHSMMHTAENYSSYMPYVPEKDEWKEFEIQNLRYNDSASHVMVKFTCTSRKGNYLYFDDINISGETSINTIDISNNMQLYPVPANNILYLNKPQEAIVEVAKLYNLQGQLLNQISFPGNSQSTNLNLSKLLVSGYTGVTIVQISGTQNNKQFYAKYRLINIK